MAQNGWASLADGAAWGPVDCGRGAGLAGKVAGASTSTYLAPFFPWSSPLLPCRNPCSACCWPASACSSDGPPLQHASSGSSLGWLVCSSTWLFVTHHCDWSGVSSCGCACCEDARYAWWRRVLVRTPAFVTDAFLCDCLYRGGQW